MKVLNQLASPSWTEDTALPYALEENFAFDKRRQKTSPSACEA
jgi:hypothetical protein